MYTTDAYFKSSKLKSPNQVDTLWLHVFTT